MGESSAPVGAKMMRFHLPSRIPRSRYPHKTLAEQPQPLPAAVHVLRFDVVEQKPAVGVALTEREPIAHEKVRDDLMPEPAEVARHDEVIVFGFCPRVAKERAQRVIGGGGHRRAMLFASVTPLSTIFPVVTCVI